MSLFRFGVGDALGLATAAVLASPVVGLSVGTAVTSGIAVKVATAVASHVYTPSLYTETLRAPVGSITATAFVATTGAGALTAIFAGYAWKQAEAYIQIR